MLNIAELSFSILLIDNISLRVDKMYNDAYFSSEYCMILTHSETGSN